MTLPAASRMNPANRMNSGKPDEARHPAASPIIQENLMTLLAANRIILIRMRMRTS
jgi:hypothetical protein